MFGVALMAMWGTAGAVTLGRSAAKSPAARELAAAVRKMNLAAKGALVAGLVCAVAIGGTKPGGNDPQRQAAHPVSAMRTVAGTNAPPFALVEVRTNGVSFASATSNAIVSKTILRRGTSEGGEWIETETPFFRWGTNPVSRVFASQAVLSFGSMRHPALGATLPDGTPAESLVALRTPVGLVPEANGSRLAAPSRFWHEETAFGRVFTWENALLDRKADRPATVQIETRDDGDFVYRYDFSDAAPTNGFFIGAQLGSAAVEALGVRGGVTNAATVYRVDGAPVPAGISVSDLFVAPQLELRWKNVAGLGDLSGDADGDGLSDWQEIHVHDTDPNQSDTDGDGVSDASEILAGANPLDADEDGNGVPDGVVPATWETNPLLAANATNGCALVEISLKTAIPVGASASLVVDDLCIPLRTPATWTLALVPGRLYTYRLNANGAAADLSVSPATNTPPLRSSPGSFPFWTEGSGDVFDGPSDGGSGHMAVPTLELSWIDPGDGSHEEGGTVGLHEENAAAFQYNILPSAINWISGLVQTAGFNRIANTLYLPLGPNGESVSGTIGLNPDRLRWGSVSETRSAHRCSASPENPYCIDCGHYIPVDICLSVSKDILTLKHDNQTWFSIVHTNSIGETHTNGMIEIRYKNGDGEWWVLGDESELQPWTARFPGRFEVRGKIDFNGNEWTTPVRDLTVQFPSVDDIRFDPSVIQRAELEWRATLDDGSTNSGWSRERGYWIVLDTKTEHYDAENLFQGSFVAPGVRADATVSEMPVNRWSDPDDEQAGAVFAVAFFHTHPPTAFWPTNAYAYGRPVGPSTNGDASAAEQLQMPGVVFDYEPDLVFSALSHTNAIPAGWPTNAPTKLYPLTPPERRSFP